MGEKDITEKNLEAWNDVFADIVNVLLFNGKKIIKEDDLEAEKTNSMFKVDGKIHEQNRDVSKFWKNGEIRISIIGFENQTKPDYTMPLRVISYDGASYKQQLLDDSLTKNYPVVTLVLYFGEEKWTAPIYLFDCFDLPKELKNYVNNYKINVFSISWLDDKTIEKFTSDFKIVAKYFQTKRLKKDYIGSNKIIRHVDETLKMLSSLTGDNFFETVYNENKDLMKGGVTMCDVVQKIKDSGKEELIINLLEANAGSIEQISEWLKLPVEKVKEIAQKVPVHK